MNTAPASSPHPYGHRLLAARAAKDEFFARSGRSPIPLERRHDFAGLAYYAPDPAYRLTGLRLEPADGGISPFGIATSDGRARTAYRIGRLRFTLGGRELVLTGYQVGEDESDRLFVPFVDETSGRATYELGRYLDLEPGADGTYTLDFNEAYHPYCAYAATYSCPLPPAENRLPVAIEAGERLGPIYRSERGRGTVR